MCRRSKRHGLTLLELLIVLTILVALGTMIVPTIGHLGRGSQKLAARENLCRLQELIVDRYLPDMDELPRPAVDGSGAVIETGTGGGNRADHPQLRYLFVNPDKTVDTEDFNDQQKSDNILGSRCWRGPYIMHAGAEYEFSDTDAAGFTLIYGEPGDPVVYDAWGHPIVLQWPTETPSSVPDLNGDGTVDAEDTFKLQRLHVRLVSAGPDGVLDTPTDVLMPDDTADPATGRDDDIVVFLFRHDEYGDGYLSLEENQ